MSKIDNTIPAQGFEIVRDRIASILAIELANQFVLTGNEDNNAPVVLERSVAFKHTEMPIVNVSLQRADYANQSTVSSEETVLYTIDIYHKSKTEGPDPGDSLASLKMQRLMGVCRAILENPVYKRLDFPYDVPFISNVHIESMEVGEPKREDTLSTSLGQLVLSVRIPEVTQLLLGQLLDGIDTSVQLELTEKGYKYTTNV